MEKKIGLQALDSQKMGDILMLTGSDTQRQGGGGGGGT